MTESEDSFDYNGKWKLGDKDIIGEILFNNICESSDEESIESNEENDDENLDEEMLSPGTRWLKSIGCERAAWHGGELVGEFLITFCYIIL